MENNAYKLQEIKDVNTSRSAKAYTKKSLRIWQPGKKRKTKRLLMVDQAIA